MYRPGSAPLSGGLGPGGHGRPGGPGQTVTEVGFTRVHVDDLDSTRPQAIGLVRRHFQSRQHMNRPGRGGCVDASLRRLPIWSADQSRHYMWRTGRPHSLLVEHERGYSGIKVQSKQIDWIQCLQPLYPRYRSG
jgi:hypothetical protein